MPIGDCANLVDCCIWNFYAYRNLALREPDLLKEQRALEDLLFALRESLVHNQQALTATLLHNRLWPAKNPKAQSMRLAVFQELKEIRQASGHTKTGFLALAGWSGGATAPKHLGAGFSLTTPAVDPTAFVPLQPAYMHAPGFLLRPP